MRQDTRGWDPPLPARLPTMSYGLNLAGCLALVMMSRSSKLTLPSWRCSAAKQGGSAAGGLC